MKTLYVKAECKIVFSSIFFMIKIGEMSEIKRYNNYLKLFLEKSFKKYSKLSLECRGIPEIWPYLLIKYSKNMRSKP